MILSPFSVRTQTEKVVGIIVLFLMTQSGFHFVFVFFFLAVIYHICPAIFFSVLAEEKQKLSFLEKWHLHGLLEGVICLF